MASTLPDAPDMSDPILAFQRRLLRWYRRHQRPLPWRRTRDPYKILVSEIMLQQTQVDRVIPKYREFLRRYPTIEDLARARARELRRVWYPLGYNIRPIRLRKLAREVVARHRGRIPNSYDGLLAMDGVGRYTAGAVLSFAFGQDAPILDTNVARLLQRYVGLPQRPRNAQTHRRLWELARRVIPPGQAYHINQAMMDFGALVCTARRPKCPTCVLRRRCRSYPYDHATPPARLRRHRRH
jgi:A/G-specific adenine glycosylase